MSRLPDGKVEMGMLGEFAGSGAPADGGAGNPASVASLLPFPVASLAIAFGVPAEYPVSSSGVPILFPEQGTTVAAEVPGASGTSRSTETATGTVGGIATLASAVGAGVVASDSASASPAARVGKPAGSGTPAALPIPKAKPPDLEALGYRLRGIIHRQFGRSSAFIFDPTRGKEIVVTAGASDPIRLLEVSDRRIVVATPKGTGTLKLGDGGPPVFRPGALPIAPLQETGTSGSATSSKTLSSATAVLASGQVRPLSPGDAQQLMKSGLLEAKEEGGRWYAVVGKLATDSPLIGAGLKEGDRIEAVGQTGFSHGAQIPGILDRWGGAESDRKITVIRDNAVFRWNAGEPPPETGIPVFTPKPSPPSRPPVASQTSPVSPGKPGIRVPPSPPPSVRRYGEQRVR